MTFRVAVVAALLFFSCAGADDGDAGDAAREVAAGGIDSGRPASVADTLPPPVANGEPMPDADDAAGIPPYPGAIVHMRDPSPRPHHVIQAFTPDRWETVAAFYEESLPGWETVSAPDMVIFRKGPGDLASLTVSPWQYEDLASDAPAVLREARAAIGAAWR